MKYKIIVGVNVLVILVNICVAYQLYQMTHRPVPRPEAQPAPPAWVPPPAPPITPSPEPFIPVTPQMLHRGVRALPVYY